MASQNPFPARATTQGYQTISSTCSETDQICLATGNLVKRVSVVAGIPTIGYPLGFKLTYNSLASTATASPVGDKWTHNAMANLVFTGSPSITMVTYIDHTGRNYNFVPSGGNWVPDGASRFFPGTLVENASTWQINGTIGSVMVFNSSGVLLSTTDPHGNMTTFQYSGGVLVGITEPTGRSITLGYTGAFITSVTDPNGNQTTLTYDVTHSNLTQITGPAGCTLQYGYTTPTNHLITSRTDPNSNVYTYGYNGSAQLTSVTDAETPSHSISYAYDTVPEYIGDNPVSTNPFLRTTLTDTFSNAWEYRFDNAGMLWRAIEPVDVANSVYQWKHYTWDSNQKLRYMTAGFPLVNNYSSTGNYAGPRDSPNNSFFLQLNDPTVGKPLLVSDGSGLVTQNTFNSQGLVSTTYPGQGCVVVQGNWVGQYGADGYLLCAFDSTLADVESLPSYIGSVSMGTATRVRLDNSTDYDHLMDPRTPMHPTTLHKGNGYWQSGSAFTMTVSPNTSKSFNLSLYTNSTDQAWDLTNGNNNPLEYNEQFGRDVTFSVTDTTGTRSFRVPNNAPGTWVTFPVTGDGSHSITVTLSPSGNNATSGSPDVRISAMMFDPLDNHETTRFRDSQTNLTCATDGLGNSAFAFYNPNGTLASSTDKNGNVTKFYYQDAYQNCTLVVDPYGNQTHMVSDKNGNVLSKTDANGHTWTTTYDGKNRPLTVTNPLGFVTQIQYDSAGNPSVTTDANGHQTQYFYTANNQLKKVTDAASESVQYAYDSAGNLYTVTDPLSNVTTYAYDNANRLTSVTRADGSIVSQAYDTQDHLIATTSPNGNQATLADINLTGALNYFRNPGAETVDTTASNVPQGWGWQGAAALDTTVAHTGNNSMLLQTSTTTNGQYFFQNAVPIPAGARTLASFWARPDGSTNAITVKGAAEVLQIDGSIAETLSPGMTLPTSSTSWQQLPLFRVDVPGYSQYANTPIQSFRAYGTAAANTPDVWFDDFTINSLSTGMAYDGQGRLLQTSMPDGTITQRLYDRFGRIVSLIDAQLNTTTMTYDCLGRLTQVADALGNTSQFSYDANGNRLSVTDPNSNVTQYLYDQKNRLVQITYPDSTTELFTYDPVSNLKTYSNNRGQVFTMTYDAANRLVKRLYGTDNSTVLYGYDAVGNLISRIERNGDVCWYSYDVVNRLVAVERDPSPGTFSSTNSWLQRHVYDAAGNRTEFDNGTAATGAVYGTDVYGTGDYATPPAHWTVPSGGYDDMNRLTKYDDRLSNQTTLSYDIESRVSGITYPNGSPQVAGTASYDLMGRLLSTDVAMGGTDILPLAYGYDPNSNRISVNTGADSFGYDVDATNRLVQEDINRVVERSYDRFIQGAASGVDVTSGALSLIAVSDTFSGAVMDFDRWRTGMTHNSFNGGMEVRQNGSLLMTFPRGYSTVSADYGSGSTTVPPTLGFGLSSNYVFGGVEHRVAFTGDFDLQFTFNDFQGFPTGNTNAALTFMMTNTSMEDVLDNGGNSFIIMRINSTPEYQSYISNNGVTTNNTSATTDTNGKLRVVRSGTTVNTYYWHSGAWTNLGTVAMYVTDTMYACIVLENFQEFTSASVVDFQNNLSAWAYNTSGTYTSAVYDAGRSVTWNELTWSATVPTGAAVAFQVAVSSSPTGPFTFVGPDGTAATYWGTTPNSASGTAFHAGTTGRYVQYQATLTGNGTSTPTVARVDLIFNGANTSAEYTYSYDNAGNMTGKVTEVLGSTTVTETRTVNNLNQITANSVVGASTTNWSFTFDASGNMTSRVNNTLSETTTYTWNEDNQITQVLLPSGSTVSYSYDAQGRMITRADSNGTTHFIWSNMDCVMEIDPSGNVTRYYILNGLMNFDRTVSGVTSTYQVHQDPIGSVRKVTNSSGSVVATYDYDAWGNQLSSTSDSIPNGGLQYRFVGALGVRWDAATGLYYMQARWYDPTLGRFVSRDPKRKSIYPYAGNNPIIAVDPSGMDLAVIKLGPVSDNPYGHLAIGITGYGVYSYGTHGDNSMINYINQALNTRSVTVYILHTDTDNDSAAANKFASLFNTIYSYVGNTCATLVGQALLAAGFAWNDSSGGLGFKSIPQDVINFQVLPYGASSITFAKGTQLNQLQENLLNQFNNTLGIPNPTLVADSSRGHSS